MIQQQVVDGLHLTIEQVQTKLQPIQGERDSRGIGWVAQQLGVSEEQLRSIEIAAIQKAYNEVLVKEGILTQQNSDSGMQTIEVWDQGTLDDNITRWFLDN